jgi:hypothetical protein
MPGVRCNPNMIRSWFGSVMEVINQVTILSILTGAGISAVWPNSAALAVIRTAILFPRWLGFGKP